MTSKPTVKCKGQRLFNGVEMLCGKDVVEGHDYCETHLYFETYTEEMMKNLVKCSKCSDKFFKKQTKQCPKCCNNIYKAQKKLKAKMDTAHPYCLGVTRATRSDDKLIQCKYHSIGKSKFCKLHQYMENYTNEMMKNLKMCQSCYRYFYGDDHDSCEICRGVIPVQHKRRDATKCLISGCNNRKITENDFCKDHQLYYRKMKAKENGFKLCANHENGCDEVMPKNYMYSKCETCLEKERQEGKRKYELYKMDKLKIKLYNKTHQYKKCVTCANIIGHPFQDTFGNTSKICVNCLFKQGTARGREELRILVKDRIEKSIIS
jgi:hypothetical protein